MNTRESLDTIFDNAQFEVHPEFTDEFILLISKSGDKDIIIDKFETLLDVINKLGCCNMCKHKQIEKLQSCRNLYSLHIETKNSNYRVLFSIIKSGKILLHTFYEKEGKKVTEYQSHVPIAKTRLDNYIKGEK
jgi:hypothetical protein